MGATKKPVVGRPSLTGKSKHSPHVSTRATPQMVAALKRIAKSTGERRSDLVRRFIEEGIARFEAEQK